MKINHIALYVLDLEKERDFYMKYFGATSSDMYTNARTGFSSYLLSFEGGAKLELMTRPMTVMQYGDAFTTGFAHMAISVGDRETVDALSERISNDGYVMAEGPRMTGDGIYQSNVLDPEGNQIEITI